MYIFYILGLAFAIHPTGGLFSLEDVKCKFYECCREPYLQLNLDRLQKNLNNNLFGQPLVKNTLYTALKGHFTLKNPKKALVLSFHGSTGVGKNFVSQFVADAFFLKGSRSKFFKQFIATKDFPHNDRLDEYKDLIKRTIEDTVKECGRALFVFDETDKIPIGLMDTIKPYIDFNPQIDGVDYRNSVFMFLSNSAGKDISQLTLNLDRNNVKRQDFELKTFQKTIQQLVYYNKDNSENKGLFHASIVDSYLIDFYIPFLPLERSHVKKCISSELNKHNLRNRENYDKNHLQADLDYIADEMVYEPPGLNRYSTSGCKRVPSLVRNLIAEKEYPLNDEL